MKLRDKLWKRDFGKCARCGKVAPAIDKNWTAHRCISWDKGQRGEQVLEEYETVCHECQKPYVKKDASAPRVGKGKRGPKKKPCIRFMVWTRDHGKCAECGQYAGAMGVKWYAQRIDRKSKGTGFAGYRTVCVTCRDLAQGGRFDRIHEWAIRRDEKAAVLARDRGVCQGCQADTNALQAAWLEAVREEWRKRFPQPVPEGRDLDRLLQSIRGGRDWPQVPEGFVNKTTPWWKVHDGRTLCLRCAKAIVLSGTISLTCETHHPRNRVLRAMVGGQPGVGKRSRRQLPE